MPNLDATFAGERPALHYFLNLKRAVVHRLREHCTHAEEREVHLHVEVLLAQRRHVRGVRVVSHRDGNEVALQHALLVRLREDHLQVVAILLE